MTVTNLDKAKTAYYEDTQALINNREEVVTEDQVQAIYASLSPEEDVLFEQYRTEVDATLYDFMMSDQSPELRAALDTFIRDNVQTIHEGTRVPSDERQKVIGALSTMDALTAMELIYHPVTQACVVKKCLDLGMTHEQIEARIKDDNAKAEASQAA
jgi:cell division protein ZapA (FtsZ GTPase activity inhibitor)